MLPGNAGFICGFAVYQRRHDPAIQLVSVRVLLLPCGNVDSNVLHFHKHIALFRNDLVEVCLLNIIILHELLEHTVRHVSRAAFLE